MKKSKTMNNICKMTSGYQGFRGRNDGQDMEKFEGLTITVRYIV